MTCPTASMLEAIANTTLYDDVFQEDTTTCDLEAHIADLTGHEASILVMSGTMGNQVALRCHLTQPPYGVLCDIRGHINCWEAGGVSSLTGATLQTVQPANAKYLTFEDVKKHTMITDNIHYVPTKVISLENTINGVVIPLEECQKIAAFARENGIKMHLDGARLWEAVASGAGSLKDYAACFDSISLCLSKGLGAPIGSVLTGSKAFVKHARWIRKSIGGGTRQAGVISSAARVAVDETFLGGKLKASHAKASELATWWTSKGGKLAVPADTNMVWLDLEGSGIDEDEIVRLGKEEGLLLGGSRFVIHYQVCDDALDKTRKVLQAAIDGAKK